MILHWVLFPRDLNQQLLLMPAASLSNGARARVFLAEKIADLRYTRVLNALLDV